MVIKTLYYVFTIFVVSVIFLLMQEPYFIDMQKANYKFAKIEINDMVDFEMDNDKIFRISSAKSAIRYDDKDVLSDIKMSFLREDFTYDLRAKSGIYRKNVVRMSDDVSIKRSDGASFLTKEISYDLDRKTFKGDKAFTYESDFLHIEGVGLVYDMDKKNLQANNIHAIYELENE